MRVSRTQAEANRMRVIDEASRLFRRHGFDGIGLAGLMKAAGLTHGGFYKQFASKEDLAAQASARAVAAAGERWQRFAERDPERPMAALAQAYLSTEHRDELADGCALAALAADASRAGPAVRGSLEDGILHHVAFLEGLLPQEAADRRERAMALLATMVGGLVLARAVNDAELSAELLRAALNDVLDQGESHRAVETH